MEATAGWKLDLDLEAPQQQNFHDCGPFAIAAMQSYVSRGNARIEGDASPDLGASLRNLHASQLLTAIREVRACDAV